MNKYYVRILDSTALYSDLSWQYVKDQEKSTLEITDYTIILIPSEGIEHEKSIILYREELNFIEYSNDIIILYMGKSNRICFACISPPGVEFRYEPETTRILADALRTFKREAPLSEYLKNKDKRFYQKLWGYEWYREIKNSDYWNAVAKLGERKDTNINESNMDLQLSEVNRSLQTAIALVITGNKGYKKQLSRCLTGYKRLPEIRDSIGKIKIFIFEWILFDQWNCRLLQRAFELMREEMRRLIVRSSDLKFRKNIGEVWGWDLSGSYVAEKRDKKERLLYQQKCIDSLLRYMRFSLLSSDIKDLPLISRIVGEQLVVLEGSLEELDDENMEIKERFLDRLNRENLEMLIVSGVYKIALRKWDDLETTFNHLENMFKLYVNPPKRQSSRMSLMDELEWAVFRIMIFRRYLAFYPDKSDKELLVRLLG